MTPQSIVALATPVGLYLALGAINLLFGHKSQINAWTESKPRLAAVLKLSRSLGLDPWMLLQSLTLVIRGRLPAAAATPLLNCRACGKPLLPENIRVADGCPCNSARGVNHGLVAPLTCTCIDCDPAGTGGTRWPLPPHLQPKRTTINPPPLGVLALAFLLLSCGGSQPDPRALVDLTPLVCRSALAVQRLEPEQVDRICADSKIGAQLAADIAEAVRKAAVSAMPAVDVGGGPSSGGGAPSSGGAGGGQ